MAHPAQGRVGYDAEAIADPAFVANSTKATPTAFGADIGRAEEGAGAEITQTADKFRGMINETAATNADVELAKQAGMLKGDYMSKTGLAAGPDAFSKYQQDLENVRQKIRGTLSGGALKAYDMLSVKTIANHVLDGSTHMASQLAEARRDSGTSLTNNAVMQALDPNYASNPARMKDLEDTAIWGHQMTLDENSPGFKTDAKTGRIGFDESTQEGKLAKANYEENVGNIKTQIQANRFEALSKGDVLGAFNIYQKERPDMSPQTQVHLDSIFAPKVFNTKIDLGKSQLIADAHQDYTKMLYQPQDSASLAARNNNPGNLRDSSTGAFLKFNTPEEGNAAMEHDLSVKISGNSKAMEANYGKGYIPTIRTLISTYAPKSENDTESYINTVAKDSGIDADAKLTQDDIKKIMPVMQRVEGGSASMATANSVQPKVYGQTPSYATNENGGRLTLSDYYRTHSEEMLRRADALAEKDMPGDLLYKRAMRETFTNYMNKVISNQSAQYSQDNRTITRAIIGEMTNGKPPMTRDELEAIPGIAPILQRVQWQDPKFAEGIDTQISRAARKNTDTNSPNGYQTILRALEPYDHDHPNGINSVDHLDRLLGRADGTGISMKDYNDAKPAIELPPEVKEPLLKTMQQITNANGNIDGKGQERAIQWYNQIMDAYKKNESLGDKKDIIFASNIGKAEGPLYTPPSPSLLTQMANKVKQFTGMGEILVENSDGEKGYIPAGNLEKALKIGYKKVE